MLEFLFAPTMESRGRELLWSPASRPWLLRFSLSDSAGYLTKSFSEERMSMICSWLALGKVKSF